jgi:hypothetical protein
MDHIKYRQRISMAVIGPSTAKGGAGPDIEGERPA